ncbi:hypothetical protein TWF506_010832 [Arthrobotrys conoides]|uniref:Uncharacterized protein n=1 Tax=Arthrobotrys conoides TaxID=74498 RepID=A0AAN8NDG9_9PEZI
MSRNYVINIETYYIMAVGVKWKNLNIQKWLLRPPPLRPCKPGGTQFLKNVYKYSLIVVFVFFLYYIFFSNKKAILFILKSVFNIY